MYRRVLGKDMVAVEVLLEEGREEAVKGRKETRGDTAKFNSRTDREVRVR